MNWFKSAINSNIEKKIKEILKNDSFVMNLMKSYDISTDDIDNNLTFVIEDLQGKFAEGNGKKIFLDKKLFEGDFFANNFHFVIHEFFHWLKRRSEHKFYFNDPEEVQSFVLAITWELINKKTIDEIEKRIYPIIEKHFKNKIESKELFKKMLNDAEKITNLYQKSRV